MTNNVVADKSIHEDPGDLYLPDFFRKEFPNLSNTIIDILKDTSKEQVFRKQDAGLSE
jgi:hypothetical protein